MKKLLILTLVFFSCNKQVEKTIQVTPVDESEVLKPKEGYSSGKRSNDFVEAQLRGKPVKNTIGNITNLSTEVKSPYQINLYWGGVRNAVKYNIYRDGVYINYSTQPYFLDYGLTQNTTYKYQVAGVASDGTVGNLSNVAYGTTFSTDGGKIILYQSFDGDTSNYAGWTAYNNGLPVITNGSGLTEEEKQTITDSITVAWSQFPNVKVTRNKAEYLAADPARRMKTIYTQDYIWYCDNSIACAGGVSYYNTLGPDIPNYVFTSALYYNTYYCYKAGTHEQGHGVGGLHHAIDYCGQSYGNDGNYMSASYSTPFMFWSIEHLISITNCPKEQQISILTQRTQ